MDTLQKTLASLPHSPGVYLYKDTKGIILYIGKARDLFNRVHQYFTAPQNFPEKTRQLVSLIHSIEVLPVATEFEALLLEAKLIRTHVPKYNSVAKDDKSPMYIHIQPINGGLPIILLSRKPKHEDADSRKDYFGPFTNKRIAFQILKTLRRSIPFCQQKQQNGKPCFYTHLGLCNPCPSALASMPEGTAKQHARAAYRTNIIRLRRILSGQSKTVIKSLQKQMFQYSKKEQFEEAEKIHTQIQTLLTTINSHYDPFHFEEIDALEKAPALQIQRLKDILTPYIPSITPLHRIECYDMSTIHGVGSGGSMVVFENGIPHTDQYRKFQIRKTNRTSDVDMMEEVIQRRFNHPEWRVPDLIIVDGGKPQVSQITSLLQTLHLSIPLIGLSKRFETIIIKKGQIFHTLPLSFSDPALQLLQHIRDEAHRFAISYHKKLRKKIFSFSP